MIIIQIYQVLIYNTFLKLVLVWVYHSIEICSCITHSIFYNSFRLTRTLLMINVFKINLLNIANGLGALIHSQMHKKKFNFMERILYKDQRFYKNILLIISKEKYYTLLNLIFIFFLNKS